MSTPVSHIPLSSNLARSTLVTGAQHVSARCGGGTRSRAAGRGISRAGISGAGTSGPGITGFGIAGFGTARAGIAGAGSAGSSIAGMRASA